VDHAALFERHEDAKRWNFLRRHWHSYIEGMQLHEWLARNLLSYGGLDRAIDEAIKRAA